MKKSYFNKAILLFELFRRHRISGDDLDKATDKAAYLTDKVDEFRLMIAMGKDVFSGRYQMSKWNLSIIVATIAYVIAPLDAIPDMVPVLGWVDDATIIAYAMSKLTDEIRKYKALAQVSPAP